MSGKILFRADGGAQMGLGHISRCLALIEMLQPDFECSIALRQPGEEVRNFVLPVCNAIYELPADDDIDGPAFAGHLNNTDIVVLDGYHFTTAFQQKLAVKKKLVYIDDVHSQRMVAHAVINHSDEASINNYDAESYTQFYLGSQYAMLRAPFLKAAKEERTITAIKNAVISMGGADPGNISQKILQALEKITAIENIHIIIGAVNPHRRHLEEYAAQHKRVRLHSNLPADDYCQLLQTNELIICPASTSMLEACAVGMIIAGGYTADNQLNILKGMDSKSAINNLGNFAMLSVSAITAALEKIIVQGAKWEEQLKAQKKMIDGKSPQRIKEIFNRLYA